MKRLTFIIVIFLTVSFFGCSYPISEIDVSRSDKACVRECSKIYSDCIQGGPVIGSQDQILKACRESYQICIETCPPDQEE